MKADGYNTFNCSKCGRVYRLGDMISSGSGCEYICGGCARRAMSSNNRAAAEIDIDQEFRDVIVRYQRENPTHEVRVMFGDEVVTRMPPIYRALIVKTLQMQNKLTVKWPWWSKRLLLPMLASIGFVAVKLGKDEKDMANWIGRIMCKTLVIEGCK